MPSLDKLNLKGKKYIIFDMDGTLVDSIGIWNMTDQEVIKRYSGKEVDLDYIQKERDGFHHDHQDGDIYLSYCEHLIKEYDLTIKDAKELLKIRWNMSGEIQEQIDFKPGVVELITKLKSLGFILILATMSTQFQLDIYFKKNKKMIKQIDIPQVFDLIVRKEDVKNKKPHPEIYNKIMDYYSARPNECLIFEDSYTGVLASKNAGIEVINIYDKYADLDRDKIDAMTDYNILNYNEFIAYLQCVYNLT